jgi:hypothetical protein
MGHSGYNRLQEKKQTNKKTKNKQTNKKQTNKQLLFQ